MAVKQARACAADLLGLRVADLAGPERWGRERVVTEEQRAMGGVTVSGWRLIGQQEQGQQARAAAMSKRQVLRRWRRR
jgi:hypothetical protein